MRFLIPVNAGLLAVFLSVGAEGASALPPLQTNARVMGELVAGEVAYQIQKNCESITMRKLRAYSKLRKLAGYAESLGYSDDDFDALSKDNGARATRDSRVNAFLAEHGVSKGNPDSYCRLGVEEIEKKSLTGWLLRAN